MNSINPDLALQLFASGAVLVIAGVPQGTYFGIDLCSYAIDEKFRGIKMIPPGPHHIWCSTRGPYGDAAPRVGFVHYFHTGEIVVREWDHEIEELRTRQIAEPELEIAHIKENLRELDRFLAPYDYSTVADWKNLTNSVTEATVERCRPALGTIRTNIELQSCPDSERPRGTSKIIHPLKSNLITDEEDLLPNLKPIEGTAPRFTELPNRLPKDASPADITRHCMDCVASVDALMQRFSTTDALIEEIQLSFVFFYVGYSVESLAQWRKILGLLAHSELAISKYRPFYVKYAEVLIYQVPRLPEELMAPTEHNTVYKDVRMLLTNLMCAGLSMPAERLSEHLLRELNWTFIGLLDEDPEEQPVVVELAAEAF